MDRYPKIIVMDEIIKMDQILRAGNGYIGIPIPLNFQKLRGRYGMINVP
jgi:hypothetical protein